MRDDLVERVLLAVEQIPAGRVASYGDIAAVCGTGPRQVGLIMSRSNGEVPWWRVTNRDGDLPAELAARALPHWAAEGIEVKPSGRGCRMGAARADLHQLTADYQAGRGDAAATP